MNNKAVKRQRGIKDTINNNNNDSDNIANIYNSKN